MDKIWLSFPNGTKVTATLKRKDEPELCESIWNFVENKPRFICHNTLSTGDSFAAFPRPTRSPNTSSHLANPVGRHKIGYTSLKCGDLLWSGSKLYVVYGACTEPSIAGAVTARIDPEYIETFVQACMNVWDYTYYYHKLAVMTVGREEE